jgi:hypothetical protein
MEAALERTHVDDLNPAAVRAYLDLPDGGVTEVESYSDAVMTRYFREYSSTTKSFPISGGSNEAFKEFAGFCAQWMLLQSNLVGHRPRPEDKRRRLQPRTGSVIRPKENGWRRYRRRRRSRKKRRRRRRERRRRSSSSGRSGRQGPPQAHQPRKSR